MSFICVACESQHPKPAYKIVGNNNGGGFRVCEAKLEQEILLHCQPCAEYITNNKNRKIAYQLLTTNKRIVELNLHKEKKRQEELQNISRWIRHKAREIELKCR